MEEDQNCEAIQWRDGFTILLERQTIASQAVACS